MVIGITRFQRCVGGGIVLKYRAGAQARCGSDTVFRALQARYSGGSYAPALCHGMGRFVCAGVHIVGRGSPSVIVTGVSWREECCFIAM